MDSVTQFALGATVGVAVLGRRIGLRKAAIAGGVMATLPDLDVFWPESDPVERFVTHRSATHSLIMHVLVTPVFGEALRRSLAALKALPWRQGVLLAWSMVFLSLSTHALLDATTIYGTQLLWPLNRVPYAVGSMFIIDPLYTVPLLVMTVWALFGNQTSTLYRKWLVTSLVVSSLYLGWSLFAQHRIEERGREILASAGLPHSQLIATPTPFNTLFWRVIAIDGPRYYNIYLAAFGGDGAGDEGTPAIQNIPVYQQVRLSPGVKCWFDHEQQGKAPVRRLAQFSQGYFSLTQRGDDLVYADLRMGMTPYYVFSYRVASGLAESLAAVPPQRLSGPRSAPGDWAWLRAGIAGQVNARPFETAQLVPATGGSVGQVALRATEPSGGRC